MTRSAVSYIRLLFALVLVCGVGRADDAPAPAEAGPARVTAEDVAERTARLIGLLGDDNYFVRERAQSELIEIGFEAFDALEFATGHEDIEIASRSAYAMRRMRVPWSVEGDSSEVVALLKNYDAQPESRRLELMQQLARFPDNQGLAPLCRMVRFERTQALSKHAAIQIITQPLAAAGEQAKRAETIDQVIRKSPRVAAEWLRVASRVPAEKGPAIAAWQQLIEAERDVLLQYPEQSSDQIVMSMLRQEVAWLESFGMPEEATAAMRKMIAMERGDSDSLAQLLKWLAERKAWGVVDELETRFSDRIDSDAVLLYHLATVRVVQGNQPAAATAAAKALKIEPDNILVHLQLGRHLRMIGLGQWSENEYRHVVTVGRPQTLNLVIFARAQLAETLHDKGDDVEAGAVLEQAAVDMETNVREGNEKQNLGRSAAETRARALYFQARVLRAQGNHAGCSELLEKAVALDPQEADALIALYRLPNQSPQQRARTSERIRSAADEFTRLMTQDPDDPDNSDSYNQFAWLIANTEGDYKEALRCSLKSLELKPETGSYIDTLARCYYAVGNLEQAVKSQRRALELDPHSGLMKRQLAIFEAALANGMKVPEPN